ncbi:hypothetical protein CP971_02130 [Streptomyces viridifaciens]|nr:hypothetical protein CP971_02130 [Streptomyces viridifaciens]
MDGGRAGTAGGVGRGADRAPGRGRRPGAGPGAVPRTGPGGTGPGRSGPGDRRGLSGGTRWSPRCPQVGALVDRWQVLGGARQSGPDRHGGCTAEALPCALARPER